MATNNMHKKFGENRFFWGISKVGECLIFFSAPGPSKSNLALDGPGVEIIAEKG